MVCIYILLWSSLLLGSMIQAYRKMDVTRERIKRVLELGEILLSLLIDFKLVNAAVVCGNLESISDLEPSSPVSYTHLTLPTTAEV